MIFRIYRDGKIISGRYLIGHKTFVKGAYGCIFEGTDKERRNEQV